jgi:hypothetical protein
MFLVACGLCIVLLIRSINSAPPPAPEGWICTPEGCFPPEPELADPAINDMRRPEPEPKEEFSILKVDNE